MNKLICGLAMALGLSFSCHAQGMKISAYPNTNNLAGTNLFLIAIVGSPGTNMNISYAQLSNLLAAAIGGGGGGAQVWTNQFGFVTFQGYTTNSSPLIVRSNDGSIFQGSNALFMWPANGNSLWLASASMVDSNEPNMMTIDTIVSDNVNKNWFSEFAVYLLADDGAGTNGWSAASLKLEAFSTNGRDDFVSAVIDPDGIGSASNFKVNFVGSDVLSVTTADGVSSEVGFKGNGSGLTNVPTIGVTGAFKVLTNGTDTATWYITNGVIKVISAP